VKAVPPPTGRCTPCLTTCLVPCLARASTALPAPGIRAASQPGPDVSKEEPRAGDEAQRPHLTHPRHRSLSFRGQSVRRHRQGRLALGRPAAPSPDTSRPASAPTRTHTHSFSLIHTARQHTRASTQANRDTVCPGMGWIGCSQTPIPRAHERIRLSTSTRACSASALSLAPLPSDAASPSLHCNPSSPRAPDARARAAAALAGVGDRAPGALTAARPSGYGGSFPCAKGTKRHWLCLEVGA
jgi:hypothetical protein